MSQTFRAQLHFWGVRGSIPTPVLENLGFGGNTTCLELRTGPDDSIIIDGGSGAHKLGTSLIERAKGASIDVSFLMTHFHWDHIQGIPFFTPLYSPSNRVAFLSSRPPDTVQEIMEGQMTRPYFPVKFDLLAARREFIELSSTPLLHGNLRVHAFPLNHPQGATGFRLEAGGAVIVHACDHEHGNPEADKTLREYAEGADLLIYDSQYTPEEYETKKGWGHSTWLEATKLARDASVKQLVLSHHDPWHSDGFLREVRTLAQREFENTHLAQEGWCVEL
jgi:phosphoribosyl 1,2-cyclic phosphodiesterase